MRKYRFLAPAIAGVLALAACTPADDGGGDGETADLAEGDGAISVTSLWGGAEGEAFQAVLDAFEEATGITANYETVRDDYATVLSTRVTGGDPPDVAIIPGIGFVRSFAADELLIPLEDLGLDADALSGAYADSVAETAQTVGAFNDTTYALMVKLNSKSTVWYHPADFEERGLAVPESYDDMVALQDAYEEPAWACGCGDTWNLTDWFESIYIRQNGVDMYDQLFAGELAFTDQSVKDSIDEMTRILNEDSLVGGVTGALGTAFTDAIAQTFSADNEAWLFYEGGFVGGIAIGQVNPDLEIGSDIGFFDFPPVGDGGSPITIGGDVMAAFVADSDVAEFMQWMASEEAGTVWAEQGTIVSPFAGVDSSAYPNELGQQEAEQIANAETARFDGSDLLPAGSPDLGATLQTALSDPGGIDQALEDFQTGVENAFADAEG